MGLRVSEEEEIIGLDIGEHDMESYAGFQIFTVEQGGFYEINYCYSTT